MNYWPEIVSTSAGSLIITGFLFSLVSIYRNWNDE